MWILKPGMMILQMQTSEKLNLFNSIVFNFNFPFILFHYYTILIFNKFNKYLLNGHPVPEANYFIKKKKKIKKIFDNLLNKKCFAH